MPSERSGLDEIDMAIITELKSDGRCSATRMSKALGIHRNTVSMRLRRLLDERIITPAIYASPAALGYRTIATIGINVEPGQADIVAEAMASLPNVHYVFICLGRYDIMVWALFRDQEELYTFMRDKLGRTAGITGIEIMVNLDIVKLAFAFLGPSHISQSDAQDVRPVTGALTAPQGNDTLDEQDLAIIRELQLEPRKSVVALSRTMGIHRNIVTAKLKRLADRDIVKAVITINPVRLGYSVIAAMGISVLPSAIEPASDMMKAAANIHSVVICTGRYDIMIWGSFHDQEELYHFVRTNLGQAPGIRDYEITIVPRVKKMSFAYLPPN